MAEYAMYCNKMIITHFPYKVVQSKSMYLECPKTNDKYQYREEKHNNKSQE